MQIVNFALSNSASIIVFEDLKSWKPKGGKKRSTEVHATLTKTAINNYNYGNYSNRKN